MIPFANPSITGLEHHHVVSALESASVSGTGSYVARMQDELKKILDRKYVLATANGTVSLDLALLALGIGPGDEVLVPNLTFVSPAAAVRSVGATPILVDVNEYTYTMDPIFADMSVGKRTKAIIAVNLLGNVANYERLRQIGLPIIEDSAQAHGSKLDGVIAGKWGVISTFSFHASKTVTAGEGGAVATDDEELYEKMKLLMNHGMDGSQPYFHKVIGRNFRLGNLQAALGYAQTLRWGELCYSKLLTQDFYMDQIKWGKLQPMLQSFTNLDRRMWTFPILSSKRDKVVAQLRDLGVDARVLWPAISTLPPYAKSTRLPLPISEDTSRIGFCLPTWSKMPPPVCQQVVDALNSIK